MTQQEQPGAYRAGYGRGLHIESVRGGQTTGESHARLALLAPFDAGSNLGDLFAWPGSALCMVNNGSRRTIGQPALRPFLMSAQRSSWLLFTLLCLARFTCGFPAL